MSDLFADKYHIKSTRLPEWDYSSAGGYYVTICVDKHKCFFGEVVDDEVKLNDIGKIVESVWLEIPNHFPNIELDEFVIMPNHLHGILYIVEPHDRVAYNSNETYNNNETHHGMSLQSKGNNMLELDNSEIHGSMSLQNKCNKFSQMQKNSISLIINQFKGSVTREVRKRFSDFKWQSGFYEHIIRDDKDLDRIRKYIQNNPYKRKNHEYYI